MSEIALSKYEKEITLRHIREEDIEEIVEVANLGFGIPGVAFEAEHYRSHVRIFPEGQFCVEYKGKIVGACSSIIVNFDEYGEDHSFDEISGDGYIRNHNPDGENLYGIDVVVHPDYRHMKIGRRLYEARRRLCRKLNLKSILFGGRMPNYHKYADTLTPEQYVEQVIKKNIYDPVITFQLMNGFKFRKVMANYLPHDHASLKNATLMEWQNDDYVPPSDRDYRRSYPVRIAAVQYPMTKIDSFADFAAQCEYYVRSSSKVRSDFVVFPEAFTMQLASYIEARVPSVQARKVAEHTEEILQLFTDLAIKYSVNIVAGSHYVQEKDDLYSAAFLFRRNGTIDKQYKLHIPQAERQWIGAQPGDGVRVFDTDCGKIAILIGYDVQFPELVRQAADRGADIIFTPFSEENAQGYWRVRYCAQARAVERHVFTVIAGAVGHLTHVREANMQYGQSAIFTPSDLAFPERGIAAEGELNNEALVVGDVDLEALRRNRRAGTVTPLADRRPSLT